MWAGRRPRCVDFLLSPQNGFVKTQKKAFGKRANNPDVGVRVFGASDMVTAAASTTAAGIAAAKSAASSTDAAPGYATRLRPEAF